MPSLVLLLIPCTPVGWYVLCKQVSAVSTECIPTCFLTACLLVYAGEREVVQSMSLTGTLSSHSQCTVSEHVYLCCVHMNYAVLRQPHCCAGCFQIVE